VAIVVAWAVWAGFRVNHWIAGERRRVDDLSKKIDEIHNALVPIEKKSH
jgi:hypothetical protein